MRWIGFGTGRARLASPIAAMMLAAAAGLAHAEDAAAPAQASSPVSAPTTASTESDVERFCTNVGVTASDARVAWEAKTLTELKDQVVAQTTALEAKRAELQKWVERRDEFRRLAEQTIVDIYAKMRPDAAAAQLASLDEETAAAVLVKLKPRTAGAIMAEMDTPRAVSLAAMIAAVGAATPKTVAQ